MSPVRQSQKSKSSVLSADAALGDNPHIEKLRGVVAKASTQPGVYRWIDEKGDVLYVGKAKNIRNRLKSYVQPSKDSGLGPWKLSMLRKIADLDVTVTNSELEALMLETNLIKELQPKYNVLMKDGKNYVYVKITAGEAYPHIEVVRRMEKDDAKYFGPYVSSFETKRTLDMLHDVFAWKACQQSIDALNRRDEKGETSDEPPLKAPCLDQQIGKCNGLCTGKLTQDDYRESIMNVVKFFRGNHAPALDALTQRMQQAAVDKKFERAAKLRDTLQYIQSLDEKQIVSDTSRENIDYIGVSLLNGNASIVLLQERDGRLIGEYSFSIKGEADTLAEIFEQFIPQYYSESADIPSILAVSADVPDALLLEEWLTQQRGTKVELRLPERGKKSKLLQLAEHNAQEKVKQQEAKWESAARSIEDALEGLKDILKFDDIPKRIEGYDISHHAGSETVGSMVVVKNGKPANDHYRSFTIRTLHKGDIDDFASLKEVLHRRLLYLVRDLKQEEKQWKENGITFGKGRKAEAQPIADIVTEHLKASKEGDPDPSEYIVARKEKEIIGLLWTRSHPGKICEIVVPWTKKDHEDLGVFLLRYYLSKLKDGKVYILASSDKEQSFADVGFRHVHKPPTPLLEQVTEGHIVMMFEAKQNKKDVSLTSCPDLLVIDGGKGQLSTIVSVLKDLELDIPLIGLAKREEEVFIPGQSNPIEFPQDSESKFLLMRLRNEAHRFANRHREQRTSKALFHSALDDVPGIGTESKKKLLQAYGTVENILQASDADLAKYITAAQVEALRLHCQGA